MSNPIKGNDISQDLTVQTRKSTSLFGGRKLEIKEGDKVLQSIWCRAISEGANLTVQIRKSTSLFGGRKLEIKEGDKVLQSIWFKGLTAGEQVIVSKSGTLQPGSGEQSLQNLVKKDDSKPVIPAENLNPPFVQETLSISIECALASPLAMLQKIMEKPSSEDVFSISDLLILTEKAKIPIPLTLKEFIKTFEPSIENHLLNKLLQSKNDSNSSDTILSTIRSLSTYKDIKKGDPLKMQEMFNDESISLDLRMFVIDTYLQAEDSELIKKEALNTCIQHLKEGVGSDQGKTRTSTREFVSLAKHLKTESFFIHEITRILTDPSSSDEWKEKILEGVPDESKKIMAQDFLTSKKPEMAYLLLEPISSTFFPGSLENTLWLNTLSSLMMKSRSDEDREKIMAKINDDPNINKEEIAKKFMEGYGKAYSGESVLLSMCEIIKALPQESLDTSYWAAQSTAATKNRSYAGPLLAKNAPAIIQKEIAKNIVDLIIQGTEIDADLVNLENIMVNLQEWISDTDLVSYIYKIIPDGKSEQKDPLNHLVKFLPSIEGDDQKDLFVKHMNEISVNNRPKIVNKIGELRALLEMVPSSYRKEAFEPDYHYVIDIALENPEDWESILDNVIDLFPKMGKTNIQNLLNLVLTINPKDRLNSILLLKILTQDIKLKTNPDLCLKLVEEVTRRGGMENIRCEDAQAFLNQYFDDSLKILENPDLNFQEESRMNEILYKLVLKYNTDSEMVDKLNEMGSKSFTDEKIRENAVFHGEFIKLIKEFGYKSNEGGICCGYAVMGAIALLCEPTGLTEFDQRLKRLGSLFKEHTTKEIVELQKQSQNKIINQLASASLKEEKQALLEEARENIDLPTFCQGVDFCHQSDKYAKDDPTLFEPGKAPLWQRDKTIESLSPLVVPEQLEKQGGLDTAISFEGNYKKFDLFIFFQNLRTILQEENTPPIAFYLGGNRHGITIGYKEGSWILIDANNSSSQKIKHEFDLAEAVFKTLKRDQPGDQLRLGIVLYVVNKNRALVQEKLHNSFQTSKMQILLKKIGFNTSVHDKKTNKK